MRCRLVHLILAAAIFAAIPLLPAEPEYPNQGPDIYDPRVDAVVLINAAVTRAKSENKRVLLDFGANWCPWCHRLHELFTNDDGVRQQVASGYVVVMIDVNKRHGTARNAAVNDQYGNPIRLGLPVLVVLDATGLPLVTQETGALEKGQGHDPEKVLAFLGKWAPSARPPQ